MRRRRYLGRKVRELQKEKKKEDRRRKEGKEGKREGKTSDIEPATDAFRGVSWQVSELCRIR
jgi:hypothetical protein